MSAVWSRSPSSSASPKFFGEKNNGDDNRHDEDEYDDNEDKDDEDEAEVENLHARLQPQCHFD